jgi:hypothetical protein
LPVGLRLSGQRNGSLNDSLILNHKLPFDRFAPHLPDQKRVLTRIEINRHTVRIHQVTPFK